MQNSIHFIKNTLGKELYSSIQINGEGFDQEWAQKSVKLLCYQRRKVFYGNNLFARGACSAGAERVINHDLKDYRYMSSSLVLLMLEWSCVSWEHRLIIR